MMGLDTQIFSSLWKDKAIIEVNVAVLHSFQVNPFNTIIYLH